MRSRTANRKRSNPLAMLICLTILFVSAQVLPFIFHYQVSDLVDTLVNHSLAHRMLHFVILLPLCLFLLIQFIAYGLFIGWIWFISASVTQLFKLPRSSTYWIAMLCWFLGVAAILTLNNYFFPDSFFADFLQQTATIKKLSNILLIVTSTLLLLITLLAYVNFFLTKSQRVLGSLFLSLIIVVSAQALYDKYFLFSFTSARLPNTQPNIILIGLDSLRPDFTRYFGNQTVHTPNIDRFLQTSTNFTESYTPLARTFPAWVTILTGKYPKHHHARNNLADPALILPNDTLAKQLKQAGYETIYATDEKRFSNITREYGFDYIIGPHMGVNDFLLGSLNDFPLSNLLINLPVGKWLFPYNYGNRAANITYQPDKFLQLVKSGLAQRSNKPVFLAIHLCLTHWPFQWAQDGQAKDATIVERYRSSIEAIDMQLGTLLQLLKANGLLDNSMVVMLSDHGTTLGLLGDRLITTKKYQGDQEKLSLINMAKLSSAPQDSANFTRDYTISTSYGQGTDVLSLKQYHVLMAFKGFGIATPAKRVQERSSLMDIAPTILDYFHFTPMQNMDGVSLKTAFSKHFQLQRTRPLFIETGDKFAEIETDHIVVEKVLKKRIGAYQLNSKNGLLFLNPRAEKSIIENKQRAILSGDWLLARYPTQPRNKLIPLSAPERHQLTLTTYQVPPYFVLANVKSGQWSVGLSSPLAKRAPIKELMQQFMEFYGDEIRPEMD